MKLRRQKRLAEQSIEAYLPEFDQYDCRIEAPWEQVASVEKIIADEQRKALIHAAINKFPDAYCIVLLLRDIEGYNKKCFPVNGDPFRKPLPCTSCDAAR